jgi:hypothetical protein
MPKLDGYQLCKIIKSSSDTKHTPVVMLSGKDGLFDKVRGKMAGCSNYITKPFEPDLLISEVRKYVKPALIPMSPNKPKKKTPESSQSGKQAADASAAAREKPADDNARPLAEQLAGLALPDSGSGSTATGAQRFSNRLAPQNPAPVSIRADDLPPLPDEAEPLRPREAARREAPHTAPAPQREIPQPPAPHHSAPPQPKRQDETPQPAPVSAAAAALSSDLDRLLAELEQQDDITAPARPAEPFRSRCPGCRTVFKNVRPEHYDKHARCKKCGSRFHLGDHLVA